MADSFWAQIEPFRNALETLIEDARAERTRRGHLATVDSQAMAEIARESELARQPSPLEPVRTAHSYTLLCLAAAEDHFSALCDVLRGDPAPLFAHIAITRAGLEACGRALWLGDPALDYRARVARVTTDRLYSLTQIANGSFPAHAIGDPKHGGTKRHPALGVFFMAAREYRAWCGEFGLTPSSRIGLRPVALGVANAPDDDEDDFDWGA